MSGSTSGSLFANINADAAFESPAPARSAARLDLLLNLLSSAADATQADEVLTLISQSALLAGVPQDEMQHKLTVRINSLISSQNALGYQLAHLWIQQAPAVWTDHLVSNASTWATQIINLLSASEKLLLHRDQSERLLASALQLAVTHLYPENIASRQEFYRQIVHPNLPKFVYGLTELLETILVKQEAGRFAAFAAHLNIVLIFLNRLLHAHPSQFRPVSSRIHALISSLLYRDDAESIPRPVFTSAAGVLSSLHLTGALASKGSDASGASARTTQAQLWQATLESQLQLAAEAWRHATSSYQANDTSKLGAEGQAYTTPQHLHAYPKDPLDATKTAHRRLSLLLGSRGRAGLINLHLRAATSRPVPVAVGQTLNLALDMLRIDLTSRFKPTAEAKVSSLQAAHVPTLHTRALALIAQLAITAPAALPLQAARVLGEICRFAEAGVSSAPTDLASARLKLAALRTLAVLVGRQGIALPLDPAGRTTLRLARLAVTQVAKSLLQPAQDSFPAASGDARKTKKARLYESDAMFASNVSLKDRIHMLSPEELACTQAALQVLVSIYPLLTTSLSAVHYDQLQISIQTVLALIEAISDSIATISTTLRHQSAGRGAPTSVELLQTAIEALADMCLDSASSTLATVLPRAIPALTKIAHAPSGAGDARVRSTAERALVAVHASRKGKYVPIAKGVGFGPRAVEDLEPAPDGAKLAGASDLGHAMPSTSEALGSSIAKATSVVLGALSADADGIEEEHSRAEGGEARTDVEAIAAESAELFQASGTDAATVSAVATPLALSSSHLGLGLPTSPRREPTEKRILSPDPVKPAHRPATPRIGSPASALPSALSRQGSPTLDTSAGASAAFLSPGRVWPTVTADAVASLSERAIDKAAQLSEAMQAVHDHHRDETETAAMRDDVEEIAGVEQTQVVRLSGNDDDDDEEMPQIDLADSEDDDEQQDQHVQA